MSIIYIERRRCCRRQCRCCYGLCLQATMSTAFVTALLLSVAQATMPIFSTVLADAAAFFARSVILLERQSCCKEEDDPRVVVAESPSL